MNSGQRMARIALGAAAENLRRTAERSGWVVKVADAPSPALLELHLLQAGDGRAFDPVVNDRVTNRRVYDGRPVSADVLTALAQETPPVGAVTTHWIGRERLKPLAALVGRADAAMFGEPSMRRAFLANVRFDNAPTAEVEEGLSLGSLELTPSDRVALRLMRRLPDWLVRCLGARKAFAAKASRLVLSSSGLCLIVAPDDAERTDLLVGRAMQQAWLALTGHGLAVQPMSSLPVLENALRHGTPELIAALGREHVKGLCEEFRGLVPEVGEGRPAFLMRFGHAPPPTSRTGRLPLSTVVIENAAKAETLTS
jgi:hypothetical protein